MGGDDFLEPIRGAMADTFDIELHAGCGAADAAANDMGEWNSLRRIRIFATIEHKFALKSTNAGIESWWGK